MSTNSRFRRNLLSSISLTALLAIVPAGSYAQNIVISANDFDGDLYGDITSFSNPGFSVTDLPDGGPGVETGNIDANFSNSGLIAGGDAGVYVGGNVGGSFSNSASIFSDDYGYGVLIDGNVVGDFTNRGDITVFYGYTGVQIEGNVGGTFNNSGNIISDFSETNSGYAYYGVYVDGNVGGDFTNSGNIVSDYYIGVLIEDNLGGNFDNSGNIIGGYYGVVIWDDVAGNFTNSGNIIAQEDGHWILGYAGVYLGGNVGGDFTNSGNIIVEDGYYYGVLVGGELKGDFTNSGNISFAGDEALYYGVFVDGNIGGNFTNSGDISVHDMAYYGVMVANNVEGDFTNSGNISSEYYTGVYIGESILGSFTNSGNIVSGTAATDVSYYGLFVTDNIGGDFTNSGNIIGEYYTAAYVGGDIGGNFTNSGNIISGTDETDFSYYGLYVEGDVDGDFTNSGNIIGEYYTAAYVGGDIVGNFNNSGNIIGGTDDTDRSYYGLYVGGDVVGDFTNSGVISDEYYTAAYVGGDIDGDFNNSGEIAGAYYGVYVGDNITGDFTNSGDISTRDLGIGWAYDGVFIDGGIGGSFDNSGNISAGDKYYGVYVAGNLGGDFTNTGEIMGADEYYGIYIAGSQDGDFTNTGNITNGDGDVQTTYIGTFVGGNITTPVNQGIVTTNANISGFTVTGFVPGFVPDGTTWDALKANVALTSDAGAQDYASSSALVGITGAITGGDTVELTTSTKAVAGAAIGAEGLGISVVAQNLIDQADGAGYATLLPVEQQFVDFLYQQGTGAGLANVLGNYSPSGTLGALAGTQLATQSFIDQLGLRLGRLNHNNGNAYGLRLDGSSGYSKQAWIQGIGSSSTQDSMGGIAGFDARSGGVSIGMDIDNGEGLQYGFAFGVSSTNVDGNTMDVDVTSYLPAIYGRYQQPDSSLYVSGIAAVNFSNFDQSRLNLFANETLVADYDGSQYLVRGEIGNDFETGMGILTPFIAGTYGMTNFGSYNEAGGATALSVASFDDSHYLLEVGARMSAQFDQGLVNVFVGWREDFDSVGAGVGATMAGANNFSTDYSVLAGGAFAGVDVVFDATENVKVKAGVGGIFGDGYTSFNGTIKAMSKF